MVRIRARSFLFLLLFCANPVAPRAQEFAVQAVETKELPNYFEVTPQLGAGGQPTDEGLRLLAQKGYQAIFNLRTDKEGFDLAAEEKLVSSLGMKYFSIPISSRDLHEEKALQFLKTMDDLKDQKVFIHCTAAIRAGSFVMINLVLREGMDQDKAEEIATRIGLTSDTLRQFARQVIEHQKKKP